jgi:hypothetical protein
MPSTRSHLTERGRPMEMKPRTLWPTVSFEGFRPISGNLAPAVTRPFPIIAICANRPWLSITKHVDGVASVGMQANPLMFIATPPSSSLNGAVT